VNIRADVYTVWRAKCATGKQQSKGAAGATGKQQQAQVEIEDATKYTPIVKRRDGAKSRGSDMQAKGKMRKARGNSYLYSQFAFATNEILI
jgi:hypothetical protein